MTRWYTILAVVLVSAVALSLAYAASADKPVEARGVERYVPDDPTPIPRPRAPERQRTIEADRIVLRGRDVLIEIRADGDRPGIYMTHRSGNASRLYFRPDGRAVIGVRAPGQGTWGVAIFTTADGSTLQMRDGRGTYLMSPRHLYRQGMPVIRDLVEGD